MSLKSALMAPEGRGVMGGSVAKTAKHEEILSQEVQQSNVPFPTSPKCEFLALGCVEGSLCFLEPFCT
eukprot:3710529-Amphidinium_carterae.1